MKRLLPLLLLILLPLASCEDGEDFDVPTGGVFRVTEQTSGAVFTACLEGENARYVFSLPKAAEGLTAETADGVEYNLSYGGVNFGTGGFAIEAACDFKAALELLKERGKVKDGVVSARADLISAEGRAEGGRLIEIDFFNGREKRIYKIDTEG